MAGNFVLKIGESAFNQVDSDQAQEWMNAVRKRGGGIVGITKSLPALSRWALSFNLRSDIGKRTREMYDETKNMHADESIPEPEPADYEWGKKVDFFSPLFITLPTIPKSCVHLASCTCTGNFTTKRCSCRKSKLTCTSYCKCLDVCLNKA